jgi:hypothetical protein
VWRVRHEPLGRLGVRRRGSRAFVFERSSGRRIILERIGQGQPGELTDHMEAHGEDLDGDALERAVSILSGPGRTGIYPGPAIRTPCSGSSRR